MKVTNGKDWATKLTWLSFIFLFVSCINHGNTKKVTVDIAPKQTVAVETDSSKHEDIYQSHDTTFYLFSDKSYQLKFHIAGMFDLGYFAYRGDEGENNVALTFIHKQSVGEKVLFKDSLSCQRELFDYGDYNNDGVKDFMIFHFDGARANAHYYLYLIDNKNHRLIHVKGFEKIPNAGLDTINSIIFGMALYGGNIDYSFYRINNQFKLIQLHKGVTDTVNGVKNQKVTEQIIKRWGRH
jgi:hypothetical protein